MKHFALLFEVRKSAYPRRLKIEIKKGIWIDIGIDNLEKIKRIASGLRERDYKVSLGSLLDDENRRYYLSNNFKLLLGKINELMSGS